MSWISVWSRIKNLRKIGLELSDLSLTKEFKTEIISTKNTGAIVLDIIDNYKPKKVKVQKTDDGFKLYLRNSFFETGEVVEMRLIGIIDHKFKLEISSYQNVFFEFIYTINNIKSVQRIEAQYRTVQT